MFGAGAAIRLNQGKASKVRIHLFQRATVIVRDVCRQVIQVTNELVMRQKFRGHHT